MPYSNSEFLASLKARLANPAALDAELTEYLNAAKREVKSDNYVYEDYIEQVLDTACYKLSLDNKFPEVSSVSQNGLTTSFSSNDPERFRRRMTERRQANIISMEL